ncbi:MAG: hypothetical protein WA139_04245 [Candidatus Aenigmatarchaeota archaeon]
MISPAFLSNFEKYNPTILLDRHEDAYSTSQMIKINSELLGNKSEKLYSFPALANQCGRVYPQVLFDSGMPLYEDRTIAEHNGASFEMKFPFILHYGCAVKYGNMRTELNGCEICGDLRPKCLSCEYEFKKRFGNNPEQHLYNWKYLEKEDMKALKTKLKGRKLAVDFDPDCLTQKAEIEIAKECGRAEGTINKFQEEYTNPFYHGFGNVVLEDLKSVQNLNIGSLFIAEAFSECRISEPVIEVGQDVLYFAASKFLKRLPHKTKAYIFENGADSFSGRKEGIAERNIAKYARAALENLSVSEIVEIKYDWSKKGLKHFLEETLPEVRDEIKKQKCEVLGIGKTHAAKAFMDPTEIGILSGLDL